MVSIRPNTLLNIADASVEYTNSEIDSYEWTKLYDTQTTGANFPEKPQSLTFTNNDVNNWYDYRNAWWVVQFQIVQRAAADKMTCRNDPLRQILKKVTLKMEEAVICDSDYINKYAVVDRACYSKQFYDTSAHMWLAGFDEDADTAAVPPSDHNGAAHAGDLRFPMGNALWNPGLVGKVPAVGSGERIKENESISNYDDLLGDTTIGPEWVNDLHTGVGKLWRYTNAYTVTNPGTIPEVLAENVNGNIITCKIPLMMLIRFHGYINTVLKNVRMTWHMDFLDNDFGKVWTMRPFSKTQGQAGGAIGLNQGFIMKNSWLELPRLLPSPSRQVSLNNTLLNSPKLSISYPNYNVYRNEVPTGTSNTEFTIHNSTERILRVSCFLQRQTYDTSDRFQPWNTICPDIREFQLKINGVPIPASFRRNSFNSQRFAYLMSTSDPDVNGGINLCDAYQDYQEQANNWFLRNPIDTKNGILPEFMGAGRMTPTQFATGSFYFTVDVARSRESQEFIGGSASLTTQWRFAKPTVEDYYCYSIVENTSLVDINLQERSAYVVTR